MPKFMQILGQNISWFVNRYWKKCNVLSWKILKAQKFIKESICVKILLLLLLQLNYYYILTFFVTNFKFANSYLIELFTAKENYYLFDKKVYPHL